MDRVSEHRCQRLIRVKVGGIGVGLDRSLEGAMTGRVEETPVVQNFCGLKRQARLKN